MAYRETGDITKALLLHENSLKLLEKLNDKHGIALTLNNIAVIKYFLGENKVSELLHLRALEIRREISDDLGTASSLNNLGVIYLLSYDDIVKAEPYIVEGWKIREKLGDKWGVSASKLFLSIIYRKQNNITLARTFTNEALDGFKKVGDKIGICEALEALAALLFTEKKFEEAIKLFAYVHNERTKYKAPLPIPKKLFYDNIQHDLIQEIGIDTYNNIISNIL